ncbi:TPR repeat-containing thioredoxin TTL1-like [Solanum dulcamara]|uniref:TPR repeat-containing thioredoxin TTL1-like n=1 Tax=Solanum dulcamara TaxID=45834 RepID=UPI002486AFBC|nr:TPR repeat-containing thioredoxin TTL1-like [Solanum dulcamara]
MLGSKKGNSEMDSKKSVSKMGSDSLADRLKNSLSCDDKEKSDEKPDLGSPVSTLRTGKSGLSSISTTSTTTTTTRSSSNSSASVSGRNVSSGQFSGRGSVKNSPTGRGRKPNRPSIFSGESSSTSPAPARNVLPPCGNLFPSGIVVTTGMASKPVRTELRSDPNWDAYGYGSIVRGGASRKSGGVAGSSTSKSGGGVVSSSRNELEELKIKGNEIYRKGNFLEALNLYDKAIAISPSDGILHCNRAAALIGLKRLGEAVRECEEAIRLAPSYVRAHQRLGSLLLSLGQVENARRHFFFEGHKPDQAELQKLQAVEKHISKCTDARKLGDWTTVLKEAEAATSSGAEASPQLFACRAEAYLKLHQLRDAEMWINKTGKYEPSAAACQSKLFGMLSEAYIFFVQAQIDTAHGRYDTARSAIERAAQIDLQSAEVTALLKSMRLVGRARTRGNELYKSARYTEACAAYGEGLSRDSSNSVLYCNRAACWYKLEEWEKCLNDCNHALLIRPNYTKALFRKAASNTKLERWAEAVRDYKVLQRELPYDKEVAESLFHAQVALKKSRGEDVHNMKYGDKVELVLDLEKFQAAITSSGASVVYFKEASNLQCKHMSSFLDTLSTKFRSLSFLKVDVERSPAIATAENITTVPTFKIYKNGSRVMEMVSPSREMLQSSVKHYSI